MAFYLAQMHNSGRAFTYQAKSHRSLLFHHHKLTRIGYVGCPGSQQPLCLWRLYGGHSQDNTLCRTYRLFLVSAVEPFLLPPSSTTLRQVELNATPMHRSIGNNTHRRKSWWTASVERLPTACMERGMCEIQWIDTTLTLLHSYSCFS